MQSSLLRVRSPGTQAMTRLRHAGLLHSPCCGDDLYLPHIYGSYGPMTTGQWGVGTIIAERYQLLEPLGEGGMGSVWRAEHLTLRSPVAIKMLNESIAENPEMLERFMREAQSAAALRSSHVVQIFDYGVEGGSPYIAMELLSGQSLADRLTRGALSAAELSWIFAHVSKAISKAHSQGITHRDLKPDNIFIVKEGDEEIGKVLDFGIAKVTDSPLISGSTSNTRTGIMLGTPHYMSPEQARGNRTVDFRCDLWALGVIAYECLTGHLPFQSNALGDLVLKICTTEAPPPSSLCRVPAQFDAWFARANQKEPDDRFQSALEMNAALQAALRGNAVRAEFPTPPAVSGDTNRGLGGKASLGAAEAGVDSARDLVAGRLSDFVTGETQVSNHEAPHGTVSNKTTGRSVSVDVDLRSQRNRTAWYLLAAVVIGTIGAAALLATRAPDAPGELPSTSSPTVAAPPTTEGARQLAVDFEPDVPPAAPDVSPTTQATTPSPPVPAPEPSVRPVIRQEQEASRPAASPKARVRPPPRPAPPPPPVVHPSPTPKNSPSPTPKPAPQTPSGDGLFSDRK